MDRASCAPRHREKQIGAIKEEASTESKPPRRARKMNSLSGSVCFSKSKKDQSSNFEPRAYNRRFKRRRADMHAGARNWAVKVSRGKMIARASYQQRRRRASRFRTASARARDPIIRRARIECLGAMERQLNLTNDTIKISALAEERGNIAEAARARCAFSRSLNALRNATERCVHPSTILSPPSPTAFSFLRYCCCCRCCCC